MGIALFCTNNIQVGVRHGQNKANPMHKYKAQQRAKEVGKNIKTWQSNSQNTMYLVHNSVQHLTVDAYTNSRRLHWSDGLVAETSSMGAAVTVQPWAAFLFSWGVP